MFGKSKENELWSKVRELINIDEGQEPKKVLELDKAPEGEQEGHFQARIKELKNFEEEIKSELNATFRRIFKALSDNEDRVKDFLKQYRQLLEEELAKTVVSARRFRNELEMDVFDELRRRIIELNAKVEDIKELSDEIKRERRKGNALFLVGSILLGIALGVAAGLITFYLCQKGNCQFFK